MSQVPAPQLRLVLAVSLDGRLAPAEGGPAQLGGPRDDQERSHQIVGHLARDRLRLVLGQRLACLRAQAHPAGGHTAGQDQHDVRAQALHLGLHPLSGTAADGDHGDHRRHPDHHAQDGQEGPQFVADDRGKGQTDRIPQHVRPFPQRGCRGSGGHR